MKVRIALCLTVWGLASVAGALASDVAIGETVQLTQGSARYTGILVRSNEVAPCEARSHGDDIVFNPSTDAVVSWSRPCPGLPRTLTSKAVQLFLSGNISLAAAAGS